MDIKKICEDIEKSNDWNRYFGEWASLEELKKALDSQNMVVVDEVEHFELAVAGKYMNTDDEMYMRYTKNADGSIHVYYSEVR